MSKLKKLTATILLGTAAVGAHAQMRLPEVPAFLGMNNFQSNFFVYAMVPAISINNIAWPFIVKYVPLPNTSTDDKALFIKNIVCNGGVAGLTPIWAMSRLQAWQKTNPYTQLSAYEIAMSNLGLLGISVIGRGCSAGFDAIFPGGRKLLDSDSPDVVSEKINSVMKNLNDRKAALRHTAKDYWLFPGDRNTAAQRRLDVATQISNQWNSERLLVLQKLNEMHAATAQVAIAERDYINCQPSGAHDPGCLVAAAKRKADFLADIEADRQSVALLLRSMARKFEDLFVTYQIPIEITTDQANNYKAGGGGFVITIQ